MATASKAAKAAWKAGPPFPIASNLSLLSKATTAAVKAASPLAAAQAFAQHGVPVFPMSPGDKKPLNEHGVYGATIDMEEIARWWKRHPDALVAVPMGRRTGMFAIDADAKPPHAHDGVGAWLALVAERGVTATVTRIHVTASDGAHFIYRWPPDRPIGCPMKGLPEGVECKGEGGAIVFPPSERGGNRYGVVRDFEPADPPQWLIDTLSPSRTGVDARLHKDAVRKELRDGLGSAYGLKALENGCARLARAGTGKRDWTIGRPCWRWDLSREAVRSTRLMRLANLSKPGATP
jgi:hypothetical protein